MRVLVIRPELQAEKTARKLEALGHNPVVFPLFKPLHKTEVARQALDRPHSVLAVTSAEAIRALQALGSHLGPHLETPLFAVGKSTAVQAKKAGFTHVQIANGDGQALGKLIADQQANLNVLSGPVLYLSGARRAGTLEDALGKQNIGCDIAEIYDMEPIVPSLEDQQAILVNRRVDSAFFFSRENANAFFDLAVFKSSTDSLRKTLFFCLSRKIVEAIPNELRKSAVISLNPDEDELIDLL